MNERRTRGLMAGGSTLCGATVGLLTNILTGRWSLTVAGGLAVALGCWIGLEVWRAARETAAPAGDVSVSQRVREVLGRVVGVRGAPPSGGGAHVDQRIDTVREGGEAVGYEDGSGRSG
ncbi:hypothetical protein ABT147_42170 [Streptomyces sp. NPDC001868]|uniref:hypothetical protein n=1 Tax=Streptomyces sp. NPDC001868 TaxID=3154401 RepID=UPI00332E6F82